VNKIILLIGIVCAAVSGYLVFQRLEEADARLAPAAYLAFSDEAGSEVLFAGDEISQADIGRIELPNGYDVFNLGGNLIEDTPVNREWIEGKRLNTNIPRGRVLSYDLFERLDTDRLDQEIERGKRAVSLSVSTTGSLNNRVVPGNRIDVLGVIEDGVDVPETVLVLEDVRVIAVGKAISYDSFRSEGERTYNTITVEVTPDEGVKLASDRRRVKGEFIVMLRNQCDTSTANATCG
jgi:pilus assembly protein CpaB